MNSPLNFSLEEFQKRITKTRKKMISTGLNTLIISDPSNMNWLTGYDGWSFYVHQAVILSLDGDPVWWGRGMDANGAKRTVFMESKNIHGYEDTYVQNPEKHPMLDLAKLIKDLQLNEGNIGVEMDNYWFSASAFFYIKKRIRCKICRCNTISKLAKSHKKQN